MPWPSPSPERSWTRSAWTTLISTILGPGDRLPGHSERFGRSASPPAFVSALEVAERAGTTIIPLDMNDELYTRDVLRQGQHLDMTASHFSPGGRRANGTTVERPGVRGQLGPHGQPFRVSGPGTGKGAHMAGVLRKLGGRYGNILAVIECERCEGIVSLQSNAFSLDRHGAMASFPSASWPPSFIITSGRWTGMQRASGNRLAEGIDRLVLYLSGTGCPSSASSCTSLAVALVRDIRILSPRHRLRHRAASLDIQHIAPRGVLLPHLRPCPAAVGVLPERREEVR